MFLVNSRLGLFSAPDLRRDPFFRRYGVNLPSSLTRVLSSASGYLPQPTCVGLRYGHSPAPLQLFWSGSPVLLALGFPATSASGGILRPAPSTEQLQRSAARLFPRPCSFTTTEWYRTINRFSIACGLTPVA